MNLPEGPPGDPPLLGQSEAAIARTPPQERSQIVKEPEVALDDQPVRRLSTRAKLTTRGQM
jgi:hypothetical protein